MGFGVLDPKYFHVGKHAHDRDDHIIYNPHNGTVYYDPTERVAMLSTRSASFSPLPA